MRMSFRRLIVFTAVAVALPWTAAAPAGDAEVPERYASVDQVKVLLDRGQRVTFIDVRVPEQFDELHIRGARSIPLRELAARLAEVPRQGLVAVY